MVYSSGARVHDSGIRVQGLECGVEGVGCSGVEGAGARRFLRRGAFAEDRDCLVRRFLHPARLPEGGGVSKECIRNTFKGFEDFYLKAKARIWS